MATSYHVGIYSYDNQLRLPMMSLRDAETEGKQMNLSVCLELALFAGHLTYQEFLTQQMKIQY